MHACPPTTCLKEGPPHHRERPGSMRAPAAVTVIAAVVCIAALAPAAATATAATSSADAPPDTVRQQPNHAATAAPVVSGKPDTSGSILTALSVALLTHNLMPVRLSAAWAAASTAAAWAYLALVRLQPWLLLQQLRAPLRGAAAQPRSAAQAEAVVAAAGLSPAAAAGAAPGAAHHWWQQGLFGIELLLSNALDSVLLLGLLLLPVIAFQCWWAGRRIGSAIPAAVRGAGGGQDGGQEAMQPSPTPLEAAAALGQAARDTLQGAAASAGSSGGIPAPAGARSERRSTDSTRARSLRRDTPLDLRQPATPPLCFEAALGQGPPGSAHHVAHNSSTAAAHPQLPQAASTGLNALRPSATHQGPALTNRQTRQLTGSGAGDSAQHGSTGMTSDGRQQQEAGTSARTMASLDLGSISNAGHSTVRPQPVCPSRALYQSPLETVVVSCKLSARTTNSASCSAGAGSSGADAAGLSPAGAEQHALPPTASSLALPSPASEPSAGHGVAAQRQLRAVVEAAVRQAVASANIGVLSTTVTSFPGCVHVVAVVSLQALAGGNAATGQLAAGVEWEAALHEILAAQLHDDSPAGGALAAAGLLLQHMLVQDTSGNVHCLWVGPPDEPDAIGSASSSPEQPASPSGLLIPSLAHADAGSSSSSSSGFRGSTHERLMHAASAITLSSFVLPTDASNAATDAQAAGGAASTTSSGPVLQLPPALTGVLAEAGAGLRIVITGGGGGSSSSAHVIADHTLWPGSSWSGENEVLLSRLLPTGVSAASLAEDHGPVLSINLVASPPTTASASAASTTSATAAAAADIDGTPDGDGGTPAGVSQHGPLGECLLLQLPVLLLPSAACAAELQQLTERMVQELGGNTAGAAQDHMLPLVRDLAAALVTQSPAAGELQRVLLQQLVAYLSGQGLHALAAAVCSANGITVTEIEEVAEPAGAAGAESSSSSGADPTAPAECGVPSGEPSGAALSGGTSSSAATQTPSSNQAAKVMQQANAAHQQALEAQRAAAATGEALQLALRQMTHLTAAAAAASRQATAAEAAAAGAHYAAAAVGEQAERQRALQLIVAPAGHMPSARGVGILGLLSGGAGSLAGSLLGGGGSAHAATSMSSAAEPPRLPARVTARHVLLGFEDGRLETQYRRLKALASRPIDTASLALQAVRQAVYVWRIARLMFTSAGTGLSLVLLCKYEAVVLLPYLVMLLTPDFFVCHRHMLLCLSHIAAALTVGMISVTEVYRREWSALLNTPAAGTTLMARPSMLLVWFYLVVPLLQQLTIPEQAVACISQLAHSLLYVFILQGPAGPSASLFLVVPLLLAASAVSFGLTYAADARFRRQAVAAARGGR